MDIASLLTAGELTVLGRLPGSSNATLLSQIVGEGGTTIKCVYKPVAGERPLWDFPDGTLAAREVAAFELSRLLGWDVIPVTVWRNDGPYGEGSIQLWIDEAEESSLVDIIDADQAHEGWLHVLTGENEAGQEVRLVHRDRFDLAKIALLDALMNNADRKAGHILIGEGDRLWGIDHGLTFNEEDKLRTVLWGWAGQEIPEALLRDIKRLHEDWDATVQVLEEHLAGYEIRALEDRIGQILLERNFPTPPQHWPAVPWPLF